VLVMKEAKIIMDDVPSSVFGRADELTSSGLDVPCVAKIAAKIREVGYVVQDSVIKLCDMQAQLEYMMDKADTGKPAKAGDSND